MTDHLGQSGDRKPSATKRGGYQGSSDPGEPTQLMQPQMRSVRHEGAIPMTDQERLGQIVCPVSDHLAVKIWAEMVALGKPTIGNPTVAQIRAALARALAGEYA